MAKDTILLDNFADWHGEVHGIEIESTLPLESYVPGGDIDVDLGRIAWAARFGHLGSVTFTGYSEQTSITPGIGTLNEDGSATATFSAAGSRAPRGDSHVDYVAPFMFNRGTANVKINFGHEDIKGDLRDAKLWAHVIDLSIKEELRASSQKKLLNPKGPRLGFLAVSTAFVAFTAAIQTGINPAGIAEAYGIDVLGMNAFLQAMHHIMPAEAEANHPEASFIPLLPLDRIGLVQAYTHNRKFVAAK